jgi:hypothetical protein
MINKMSPMKLMNPSAINAIDIIPDERKGEPEGIGVLPPLINKF